MHVFNVHTHAFIGHDPDANDNTTYYNNTTNYGAGNVHAKGSVVLSANELSNVTEVVGVLAAGEVGVAAGAGINVINKDTKAFIGDGAAVTGDGNTAGLKVNTGRVDTGIDNSAPAVHAECGRHVRIFRCHDRKPRHDPSGNDYRPHDWCPRSLQPRRRWNRHRRPDERE